MVVFVITGIFFALNDDQKLVYEGKTMDDWFDQLPLTVLMRNPSIGFIQVRTNVYKHSDLGMTYRTDLNGAEPALKAFSHFGTNALPYLMDRIELKPKQANRWRKFYEFMGKYGIKLSYHPGWLPEVPEINRMKAASALLSCESLKADAIVELTKLKNSPEITNGSMANALLHFLENEIGE